MAKHIGIIAVSFEGAGLCYRTICGEAMALSGSLDHPEISLHNHSLKEYMRYIEKGDWGGVAVLMASSAKKLAAAGADYAVCPDNTVHQAFEEAAKQSPIPLLSIVEIVANECNSKGYRKVGVLGTKYTMQGPIYRDALSRFKIGMVVPSRKDQKRVNAIIFNDLVPEGTTKRAAKELIQIVQRLKEAGCKAVILGCTELPLVLNTENSPLPVVDSTRLLAREALKYALK